ncbi:MAG: pantoate--beta-alanine ligase [Actinomycetota bacterium]
MTKTVSRDSGLASFRKTMVSPVIFVPTMGALHNGHAALIAQAREISPSVVVSIFVNPLQFENAQDLENYPVTHDSDRTIAEAAGAKFIWIPSYEEVYPGEVEKVSAGPLGRVFEGHSRDGHFDGVLTVVKRLFDSVRPDKAIFGEKDFQQLFLIRKMVKELNLEVEVIAHPTVRDADGLALSSRNSRLSDEGRSAAKVIYRALVEASTSPKPRSTLHKALMSEPGFKIDYAEVINEKNLSIVEDGNQNADRRSIVAGWIDDLRLIDNMKIERGA